MHKLSVLASVVVALVYPRTAGAALPQDVQASSGCEDDKWTYVQDNNKRITARGVIISHRVDDGDGDLHVNLRLPSADKAIVLNMDRHLTTEVAITHGGMYIIGANGATFDPGPFASFVKEKLRNNMNAVARGDWVIDEHDYWQPWKEHTKHAELHPLRYLKASTDPDPTNTSNVFFLVAQDWHHCRAFKAAGKTIAEDISLEIPDLADDHNLAIAGARKTQLGFIKEESMLDARPSSAGGTIRSSYSSTHSGFPSSPKLSVAVSLGSPVSLINYFPGYAAAFSTGESQLLDEETTYSVVSMHNSKKAVDVRAKLTLTGWPTSTSVQTGKWTVVASPSGISATTNVTSPINKPFTITKRYAPSLGLNDHQWTVALRAHDRPINALPNPASLGPSVFVFANRQRTFGLTPSHITIARASGPPSAGCDTTITLRATLHLLPQIAKSTRIAWRAGKDLEGYSDARPEAKSRSPFGTSMPSAVAADGFDFWPDRRDEYLAYIKIKALSVVTVEARAETDAGEKMVSRVEVAPLCNPIFIDLPTYKDYALPDKMPKPRDLWFHIWSGGLALQLLSRSGDSVLPPQATLPQSAIGQRDNVLSSDQWGARLSGTMQEERDAFLAFVRGVPLDSAKRSALLRVAIRGKGIATTGDTAAISRKFDRQMIRPVLIETNGRLVRQR